VLLFFNVAYVSAVDVFSLRCIVNSVRFKVKIACDVTSGVPSRLIILFLMCSLLVCSNFLAVLWYYSWSPFLVVVCFALVAVFFCTLVALWCVTDVGGVSRFQRRRVWDLQIP
jgi:hypothetical protein